jgi:hypothetical protein
MDVRSSPNSLLMAEIGLWTQGSTGLLIGMLALASFLLELDLRQIKPAPLLLMLELAWLLRRLLTLLR